jgi:riboflavin synthase
MFTGIVEPGEIVKADDGVLWVRAPLLGDCAIGASVAINGVCLTVTERDGDTCRFDAMDETLTRSALGALKTGDRVNLERPVKAGDELGGHIVQGHVDAVGEVDEVSRDGDDVRVRVRAGAELMRYVVEKGSITIDGVSLTVSSLGDDWFEVSLIPHTLNVTTFGEATQGRKVNLEVDVLAKYVEKLTTGGARSAPPSEQKGI